MRIQEDEALDSYVARCLAISRGNLRDPELIRDVYCWTRDDVKAVALALGWDGCYGFNKLLHLHTSYPVESLISSPGDLSYSGGLYTDKHNPLLINYIGSDGVYLCLECARLDLEYKGFIYWRRSHQFNKKLCSIHNVVLQSDCRLCGELFIFKMEPGFLWSPCCCGEKFLDAEVFYSSDELDIRTARLYWDVLCFNSRIPKPVAYEAINRRFITSSFDVERFREIVFSRYGGVWPSEWLESGLLEILRYCESGFENVVDNIISFYDVIIFMFSCFQEFVDYIKDMSADFTSVNSLWPIHRVGSGLNGELFYSDR
ncbi:TniQ family protein [Pseudomonas sp. MOB-449]|nr:TniQ family protein [Pseudomonas sp. MOB-449]